jgi:hypothetical protein
VLGVSVGTVKSQTARALDRIRAVAPELADLHHHTGDAEPTARSYGGAR